MGLFDIFRRKKIEKVAQNPVHELFSSSGNVITGHDSTSFAAIDMIASAFAGLSGTFYDIETRQAIKDHRLYKLIKEPNYEETKFTFFYNSVKDYFDGNVYWYCYYDEEGEIISLFRLNTNSVRVKRDQDNQKVFMYKGQEYYSDKILHIPSRYGYNGVAGNSIFNECRTIFSTASEIDSYTNGTFNNSIGKRLIIDITKRYPDASNEQIQQLRNKFMAQYAGAKNAGTPLIKSKDIDYSSIDSGLTDNRSNQLVENREFQEREVSKLFGVPLALLTGKETANLEALYTIFTENAIRPVATAFEQEINKLIPVVDRDSIYFEYSYNSLMKTSLQARIEAYTKQINNGMLSVNEVRHKENLAEVEAGDTLFIPANLMPLRKDIIDAYMAKSKLTQEEINGIHSPLGDDKI
jgi:HK97 family phage portal protein